MNQIAENLHAVRINKGLSIPEACKLLRITERAIKDYEAGKRIPRDEIKENYAAVFGVSIHDLFFPEQ